MSNNSRRMFMVLGAFAFVLTLSACKPAAQVNTNTSLNTNSGANTNANVETNGNTNQGTNVNENLNANQSTNVNVNSNVNANTNVNTNLNSNTNQNVNLNVNANVNANVNVNVPAVKTINLSARNFAFSQNQIKVKKGETVKIVLNVTEGFHDWVVDEFNAATQQVGVGKTTEVQFVASKTGTFEYYCSVGQHRQMGMKGSLIVE